MLMQPLGLLLACRQANELRGLGSEDQATTPRLALRTTGSRQTWFSLEMNNDRENETSSARKAENTHGNVVLRRVLDVKTDCYEISTLTKCYFENDERDSKRSGNDEPRPERQMQRTQRARAAITLPLLMEEIPVVIRREMWFQHDGAPPHFSLVVRTHPNKSYREKWIEGGGPVPLGRPGVDSHCRHEGEGAVLQIQFLLNEGALITATSDDSLHLWNFRQKKPEVVHSLKFQRERKLEVSSQKKKKKKQRRILTEEGLHDIRNRLEYSPRKYIRRLAQVGISYGKLTDRKRDHAFFNRTLPLLTLRIFS
ncbi:hypothetical protein ANN_24610 [Periplaneta americana]|uniref:Uncharacterized protein n=1 Tax=Periplaneta americana TaxID=6978 RepID=A0ABQ8S3W0_PERAM|nr:hypothetical protein ANN_24610 [Periplaneta americana]